MLSIASYHRREVAVSRRPFHRGVSARRQGLTRSVSYGGIVRALRFVLIGLMASMLLVQAGRAQAFYFGHDLSYANQMEDCGADFKEGGVSKDVYEIFADHGTNLVRARLWVDPSWQNGLRQPEGVKAQYSDLADVKETFARARAHGMQLMLGFHYSDFWADPARQVIPARWQHAADDVDVLADSVYQYMADVLAELEEEGLMPDIVKVGNETNSGMLIYTAMDDDYDGVDPAPEAWAWERQATLFNAAIRAVRDAGATASIDPKIALHVAGLSNLAGRYQRFIDFGVTDFDIMGFSYYYAWHQASIEQLGNAVEDLARRFPGYEPMVVETGYLWTTRNNGDLPNIIDTPSPDYLPVLPEKQLEYMVDYARTVRRAGGAGVIFWEPAWVTTDCRTPWGRGSSQEHVAFFDWEHTNFMENGGGRWPERRFYEDLDAHKVVFKVDMSGQDVSGGVYITGSFTGEPRQIVPMADEGNGIYSYFTYLPEGAVGTYYFLNGDEESARETVPTACAEGGNRVYTVPAGDVTYTAAWGACATSAGGTVEVTFAVDMSGQDVSRGVFVTGDMTEWAIMRLTDTGEGVYTHTLELPVGSSGAYYYLTTATWEDYEDYREEVPAACADWYGSDRGYVVPAADTTLAVRWGTCEVFEVSTAASESAPRPAGWRLHPGYPNPFTHETTIAYELAAPARVTLSVYDGLGREVAVLVDRPQAAGTYRVPFAAGGLAPGLYVCRLEVGGQAATRAVTLTR